MRVLRSLAPLGAALLALVVAPSFADDAAPKKFFWKVTAENGSEVYLLGSIHVGTEDMYPLPKEIEHAFEKSDALAVEADVEGGDPTKLQAMVMEKGMCKEGDSLKKHISKENYAKLKEYCEKEGVPLDQLKRLKPWLVAIQLQGVMMQKLGVEATYGVDRHFLIKAKKKLKKPVLELESAEMQIGMLADFADDLQEIFLMSIVVEQSKGKEALDALMDAWKKGDDEKVIELSTKDAKDHPEFEKIMSKLNDERNVGMVKKIEEWLAQEKSSKFVVVGSLHTVGDKGIVKLLEATKKYKIERPTLTAPAKEDKSDEKKSEKKELEKSGAK